MPAIGSNTIEFRKARVWVSDGHDGFRHEWVTQVRTKDVIISVLGASLGIWSAWKSIEFDTFVELNEDETPR